MARYGIHTWDETEQGVKDKDAGFHTDFQRCGACGWGYWVNYCARSPSVECPYCGHVQQR